MWRICYFVFILFTGTLVPPSFSAALTCSGTSSIGGNFTIPHVNITAPNTPSGYAILYTAQNTKMGNAVVRAECSGSISYNYSLMNPQSGTTHTYNGYTIYPTSIKGIGISINSAVSSTSASVPFWPEILTVRRSADTTNGVVDTYVTIRLWKTPEFSPSIGSQEILIPTIIETVQPLNSADTFSTCPSGSVRLGTDNRTCEMLTRDLKIAAVIQTGTCDMVVANQTVSMGKHEGINSNNSTWVDASFSLTCPQAWGYGGSVANSTSLYDTSNGSKTANTTKNQAVKIQIRPYTPIISDTSGIFELDPGGATGFGIQLAWGLPSSQLSKPTNPVIFSTRTSANSISSAFASGPYAIGGYALPAGTQGVIPLSARYTRTTGTVNGGPANGKVEILASYE